MDTPSERLAKQITARLVQEGLLSGDDANAMRPKLAEGSLKGEDWRLPIELAAARAAKP